MRYKGLLPLLLLPALAGCKWQAVWHAAAPDCRPGITAVGQTTVLYVSCRDRLLCAVWSDISAGSTEGGGSSSAGRAEWHNSAKAHDGRTVELKVVTTAGTWTITVNGKEYRLEDGALFLVRTRGGSTKVTQIKQDLSGLPPTNETWQRLARESPDVRDFIAEAGVTKEGAR